MHDGRQLALDDIVEYLNMILGTQLTAQEKKGLVEFLLALWLKTLHCLDEKKPLGGLTQSAKPRWEFLAHSQSPRIQLIAVLVLRKISGSGEAPNPDLLRDRQQLRVDEKLRGFRGDSV